MIHVHLLLIDYIKAFESVNQKYLIRTPEKHGIPTGLIEIIKDMYTDLKPRIITDVTASYFRVERGVGKEDSLSCIRLNCLLEVLNR